MLQNSVVCSPHVIPNIYDHMQQLPYKKIKKATHLCCLHTYKPDLWFGSVSKPTCRYTPRPLHPSGIFLLCDFQCLLSRSSPVLNTPSRNLGLLTVYSRILWPVLSIKKTTKQAILFLVGITISKISILLEGSEREREGNPHVGCRLNFITLSVVG